MIVGELTHDHEIVWNVRYESLWDDLGMSDIIKSNEINMATRGSYVHNSMIESSGASRKC